MSKARSLNDELVAILGFLPTQTLADEQARSEAQTVLYHCALAIDVAVWSWPDEASMARLATCGQGYGCWLSDIRQAIDRAALDPQSRDLWRVAHSGATALLFAYHMQAKRRTSIEERIE